MYRRKFKPSKIDRVEESIEADEIHAPHQSSTIAMTVDEMAEELRISRPTAYELVKSADFPSFRIGNRILVNRKGLQQWVDSQCLQKHELSSNEGLTARLSESG